LNLAPDVSFARLRRHAIWAMGLFALAGLWFGVLFRYILLCIALFVIIGVWHANVVAVALGFSAPVAAVFVECGLHAYQEFKAEREPGQ